MPLDLGPVVQARLALDQARLDAIEEIYRQGPSAPLIDRVAGDRLRSIVGQQRSLLEATAARRPRFDVIAEVQVATDRSTGEALDLAMGVLAREAGLDEGACDEADRFVRWFAERVDRRMARMSVPGTEESVHRSLDTIYRRVPDHGIWDLPTMAHELGHLMADGLRSWDPRDDVVVSPIETQLARFADIPRGQAVELFSDLFATWVLGPSFLCMQVFHRMNPWAAATGRPDDSHPSDAVRVAAVRHLLAQMSGGQMHGFDAQVFWAGTAWDQMQADGPAYAVLTDEAVRGVNGAVNDWTAVLSAQLGSVACGWSGAVDDLVRHLRTGSGSRPEDLSPADVLNAAWLVRLGEWFERRPAASGYEVRAATVLRAVCTGGVTA